MDRLAPLSTFLKSQMPVFVHAKGSVSQPTDVQTYLANCTLSTVSSSSSSSKTTEPPTLLPGDTQGLLTYTKPSVDKSTPTAYIMVRGANEDVYINHTDISINLLYPPSQGFAGGWSSITMRFNNTTLALVAVLFPKLGWIYNLDQNFISTSPSPVNPLRIIRTASPTDTAQNTTSTNQDGSSPTSRFTKLHVFVGADDLVPTPTFPAKTTNAQIIDTSAQSIFGLSMDSGASYELVEAAMLRDDEQGLGNVVSGAGAWESWAKWGGRWVDHGSGGDQSGLTERFGA